MSTFVKTLALGLGLAVAGCGAFRGKGEKRDDSPAVEPVPAPEPDDTHGSDDDTSAGPLIFPAEDGTAAANGAFVVKVEWLDGGPKASGKNRCRLLFADGARHAVQSLAGVTFKPWMTSMDHGGGVRSLQLTPEAGTPGAVVASGFQFGMGGPWDLIVGATVNGVAGEARIGVKVPE
jgi:hypothetical protein